MSLAGHVSRAVTRALLPAAQRERLAGLQLRDAGHGWDRLGMHPDSVKLSAATTRFLYDVWFRVDSRGAEHVPSTGPAILAANHAGLLPLDGMMLWADVLRQTSPPRVARMVADTFVPRLPFVGTAFSRSGVVGGTRGTVDRLLDDGELLGIFPEGVPGIAKPFAERYQLRPFRVGHAELAIQHGAPIVPVGIIGSEEQWPELARIESFHAWGAPYLPIPATPIPLPVRYRIRYGAPIDPRGRFSARQADDPAAARTLAREVQAAVQALVDEGLRERKGIFR
ncbi:lysophospholipid acyltransferase family protein [Sandaracinus amylolyticus]|uniref:1-acyl-sn-glycerol-3-phosphate acyltransferase n=1 Tax=Sandaracinus amylolyticus TaxID=927083 RepID=A0A0F6WAQ1_9BACT|nr:lysophospholipid acyltransferase family protein [Sandaracinus amylolyticus]AKF11756.1 1-acyl-sn-glycerol-3-phosphate acyltransferase [Sandaracinus amylolyticus]